MSVQSDNYWNSAEGLAMRRRLSDITREQRQRLPNPRVISASFNKVAEYDERKRSEFKTICAKYNYCCVACGSHGPMTRDHIRPTIKMGTSAPDNIQPLCIHCNMQKARQIIDFRLNPHPHCLAP
jgi:5-methylcytosine-specific restriction endonuclease McrA